MRPRSGQRWQTRLPRCIPHAARSNHRMTSLWQQRPFRCHRLQQSGCAGAFSPRRHKGRGSSRSGHAPAGSRRARHQLGPQTGPCRHCARFHAGSAWAQPDAAHARLDAGLTQAMAMGARLVLVITGNPRPVAAADRGDRRGAIRAKLLDWLAAGAHAGRIAAVRPAHRKHGGPGALYLVLRRVR